MATLSFTCTSLPAPNNRTPLHTITFPSNSKIHLAFPLSNSKRLNFSLKAEKKDDFSEENEAKTESYQKKYDTLMKIMELSKAKRMKEDWPKSNQDKNGLNIENIRAKLNILNEVEFLNKASFMEIICSFRPLNLIELKECFDDNIFSVTKVERYGYGGRFYGNLRVPVEQALPELETRLSEKAGKEVDLYFSKADKDLEVVTVVLKSYMDLTFKFEKRFTQSGYEVERRSIQSGYNIAAALSVTTLGTTALMSGFFLKPDATFDYYLADVLPLFGGFLTILGVSEIATQVTAAQYGVKLGPSFLVPSIWTGCLGVMNDYESRLPNMKAWFDIPVARTASAYLTSLSLIVAAFLSDGSLNGGDNPLYLRPDFFFNSPLVSLIQLINGGDLSNRLPYEVDGVGVSLDPLALAGLLGMIMTSLNLLPCGGLEGRRIFEAMFGRKASEIVSRATTLILLGTGVLSGSVLFVVWGVFITKYESRGEVIAKDEITPLGEGRYALGFLLALICFLTVFPNAAGTFSSWSLIEPYFRVEPYFRGFV